MIIIYTICYNTPDFIEIQYKSLKKYLTNEFQYIIFNNTMTNTNITKTNIDNNNTLINACNKYNLKFYDIPKYIFNNINDNNASMRAGMAIDFSNKILFNNYDLTNTFFLLDSDAFLITEFNIEEFMQNKKISGRIQLRKGLNEEVKYLTNQIVIYKPSLFEKDLFFKNFSFLPCIIDFKAQCECGGKIHNILIELDLNSDFINWTNNLFTSHGNNKQLYGGSPINKEDFDLSCIEKLHKDIKNLIVNDTKILNKEFPFCEIFGNEYNKNVLFLHLRAGTNWINYNIDERNKNLFNYLNI